MTYDWMLFACLFLALWSAVIAGVFSAFSEFIMAGLLRGSPAAGIEAMQQINLIDQKFMLLMKHPLLADYCIWNERRKLWLSHHTLRPNDREEAS